MRAIAAELVWTGRELERDKVLLVEGDTCVGLSERADAPRDARLEDWGRVALVPGTVNAHGHSFQNLLKGFADDRPFASWRDDVLYPFSEQLGPEGIYAGALFAFAEALLAGVTTTVDFFYLHDGGNANAEHVIQAARDLGIRLVFARTFYDIDAPTRAPARYREDADAAARRCLELARRHHAEAAVSVQPAPHSLHAASPQTIRKALDVATELNAPCHLHLAEASYEREQTLQRYGATPVRLLAREGLLDERLVLVHSVWLDDEEIELVAHSGAAVVHCPGANAFLGDGIARAPELLARGVRVALGPDGGCANNRQSVLDEMRTASLLAKARLRDGGAFDAGTAFELGTRMGGNVLQLPVGSFAEGANADALALDLEDLSLHPLDTIERQIVNSMQPTAIARVMVGGDVVVEGGNLTRVDATYVRERVAKATAGWTRS